LFKLLLLFVRNQVLLLGWKFNFYSLITTYSVDKKEKVASRKLWVYTLFIKIMNSKKLNWVILCFGTWVILSPLLLGSVGTVLFYSNTIIGTLLVIFAVKNIIGGKGIKI